MSAECVLLARQRLGLPEAVKSRERLAKSCQNCCQNQRAKSHHSPRVEALFRGLTIPVHFSFSTPGQIDGFCPMVVCYSTRMSETVNVRCLEFRFLGP